MKDLKTRIYTELLPYILKPGRLIGNELGAVEPNGDDKISVALAYPDLYDLGMSNLGLSILYHIINSRPNGRAERVFAVTEDVFELMTEKHIPLFSLESKRPVKEFDLLGFNAATELTLTNILAMLDLAGIPLTSPERNENDPLVVIGGGCAFNPEPMADFADFFFLGDAEEAITEIIDCLKTNRDKNRSEKLFELSQIEGVYVPSYYSAHYDQDGKFAGLEVIRQGAPAKIKARTVDKLKDNFYPATPLVPAVEVAHDRLAVEIMRGCGHACRFCQATVIYRPARRRKVDDIVRQVETNLANSGYNEVTLLSLSSGDYRDIETLVARLAKRLKKNRITISLPSLRISSMSLELAELVTSNRKTGLTFAPEAGTDRLRKVINKPLREEVLVDVLTEAFNKGWMTIKLYFMIGLPTETDEDLTAITDLLNKLSRISRKFKGRRNINVTLSPFCPKPHTPWQWERQAEIDEIYEKQRLLKKTIRGRNVNLKFHDPHITWLEGVLGRGDRRLGKVILRAYRMGAKMDGWSESFQFETWQKAFEDEQIDPCMYLNAKSTSQPLPWDHIEKGLSKETLIKQLAVSRGLTDVVTSLDRDNDQSGEKVSAENASSTSGISYGRAPKALKPQADKTVPQSRLRIRWGRSGPSRFLSHLDNMRAIERALRRANLPLAYSQGHKPHPKLSYGPPLALGFTSEAEYLDIQLEVPAQNYMLEKLSRKFPPDFQLYESKTVFGKATSLSSQLNLAVYQIEVDRPVDELLLKTDRILTADVITIQRETKNGQQELDIRRGIIDLKAEKISEASTLLTLETAMADLGFVKVQEVLEFGYGFNTEEIMGFTIHRKNMFRLEDGRRFDPFELL